MTDLTDRMRTCAAYIMSRPHDAPMPTEHLLDDAAALLIEASNALELVQAARTADALFRGAPTDAPMQIIPPGNQMAADRIPPLPYHEGLAIAQERLNPRACPRCDSRSAKKVRRQGRQLMLQCPVCGEQWEWVRDD